MRIYTFPALDQSYVPPYLNGNLGTPPSDKTSLNTMLGFPTNQTGLIPKPLYPPLSLVKKIEPGLVIGSTPNTYMQSVDQQGITDMGATKSTSTIPTWGFMLFAVILFIVAFWLF